MYNYYTKDDNNIEIIKDSQIFVSTTIDKLDKKRPCLMDFIIYSNKNNSTNQVNKILYFDMPNNFLYEKCKFKFIYIILTFSRDEEYTLELFDENENYFIKNNKLNKYLFCYLIRNRFGVIKNEDNVNYKLRIMDQDVNFIDLNEKQEILLDVDSYSILKIETNDKKDCKKDNNDNLPITLVEDYVYT